MIPLLLKELRPVEMPETVTLLCFHFLLPDLLKVRNSLPTALKLLDGHLIGQLPACPAPDVEGLLKQSAAAEIKPQVGITRQSAALRKSPGCSSPSTVSLSLSVSRCISSACSYLTLSQPQSTKT